MQENDFKIFFELDDPSHAGKVSPSEEKDKNGAPAYFHVAVDDVVLGDMRLNDCHWALDHRHSSFLVDAIGKEIEKHYKL